MENNYTVTDNHASADGKIHHIISACVNIGLPVNIGRGMNIRLTDVFTSLLITRFFKERMNVN